MFSQGSTIIPRDLKLYCYINSSFGRKNIFLRILSWSRKYLLETRIRDVTLFIVVSITAGHKDKTFREAFLYLRRRSILSPGGEALMQHVSMATIYFLSRYIFLPRKTKRRCEIWISEGTEHSLILGGERGVIAYMRGSKRYVVRFIILDLVCKAHVRAILTRNIRL